MKTFCSQLQKDKIKINWNKNPIPMKLFLSFLTVEVERQTDFLGSGFGWTQYKGVNNLIVTGGFVNGTEYLDNIQYGKNLDNRYNNFVNPFYLFEIMNKAGKKFFLDYYAEDITNVKKDAENKVKKASKELDSSIQNLNSLFAFWRSMKQDTALDPDGNS